MRDHAQARAKSPATPPPPVLPRFDRDLSPRAQRVLWSLTEWAWGHKPACYPSVKAIAEVTGYCKRTIGLAVAELEAKGYIATHYNRTNVGRYRVIVILDRVPTPRLRMVDPGASDDRPRGGATAGGSGAKGCATPAQSVAPPMAQAIAPQEDSFEKAQREEKKNSEATSPREGGSPRSQEPEGEPAWRKLDQLTPEDVARMRAIARDPTDPMAPIYAAVLRRHDRQYPGMRACTEGKPGPASREEPPGQAARDKVDDSVQLDPTRSGKMDQDKPGRKEHNPHYR
jgi:Helix-turn-helix domain